jgi:hypothetical protein
MHETGTLDKFRALVVEGVKACTHVIGAHEFIQQADLMLAGTGIGAQARAMFCQGLLDELDLSPKTPGFSRNVQRFFRLEPFSPRHAVPSRSVCDALGDASLEEWESQRSAIRNRAAALPDGSSLRASHWIR